MITMCSKCGKRPAVVFIADGSGNQTKGLCLVCAKEIGIKPVDDLLAKMNISDDDLAGISDQMMEMMNINGENDDDDFDDDMAGGAPSFPFLNNIFGAQSGKDDEQKQDNGKKPPHKNKKRKFLSTYCENLTQKARDGRIDNVVCRDKEIERAIQILSRRTKNNPCLIGEPGVGKTAIVEGLALKIAKGDAPARLLDQEIYLLDLTGLVAGTQFRGQFESRVKGLLDEIKQEGNIILFIDEVHNIVGAGNSEGAMNAGNILKPALSRGEIHVNGATTLKEYRQYIEKDAALERRFQPINVEEPSIADTTEMLTAVKGYYEGYHNVKISEQIVAKAVLWSEKYITDRFLPDKAIDLIDEASACCCLRNKAVDDLYKANKKVTKLLKDEGEAQAEENPDYEKIANIRSELEKAKAEVNTHSAAACNNLVTDDDLAFVIQLWTGIEISKIKESDLNKLKNLEQSLLKDVKGQNQAVSKVAAAVKRSRVKINKNRDPASFIFVGPTGVGKTELAKSLSRYLFDTPETLIRFDMSEFMEKHSVSRLIGAPPGYVGYDEAGQLTEKVRRKPYSVVLFDEIEKAHPDVLNVLLQILDDGRVTDAQGRVVNFENAIIIMTSNAGSEKTDTLLGFGKTASQASSEKAIKALEEFLRPEFIARVDDVVVFDPLNVDALKDIAVIALEDLKIMLFEKDIQFSYTKETPLYFAENCNALKRGARDLKNNIRKQVEDKIVDGMIEADDKIIKSITLDCKNDVNLEFIYK
ncbi:MAG: ATP-dependent Clp protease ATP-binding subunit [Oscillospiraceae bacterium]|nr:ATP-dependent Clp protease ATP-binding subunit [Candidatus Equicaccousia limihippi]